MFIRNMAWIEVICGPMFCGKSDEFIRRCKREIIGKRKTHIFKSAKDTRKLSDYEIESVVLEDGFEYKKGRVESRSGAYLDAILINTGTDIINYCNHFGYPEVIGIDEAQLFDDISILDAIHKFVKKKCKIIIDGLDKDYTGYTFGFMDHILIQADEVDKLSAVCSKCGNPATETQLLINGEPATDMSDNIIIEDPDNQDKVKYEARCKNCTQRP